MGNSELSFFVNMKLWLFGSSNACKKQDRQNNTEEFHWYNKKIKKKKNESDRNTNKYGNTNESYKKP